MSSDPAMADGLNWYRYANNNPIMYMDPTGLSSVGGNTGSSSSSTGNSSSTIDNSGGSSGTSSTTGEGGTQPVDNNDDTGTSNNNDNTGSSDTSGNDGRQQWEIDKENAQRAYDEMQSSGGFLSPEAFAALPYEDQQDYIRKMANKANDPNTSPAVRGAIAMHLRHLRSTGAMSNEFLDQFMADDEEFFNLNLRDAMNLNYDGTANYSKHQIDNERDENGKKMWIRGAAAMHQRKSKGWNKKFYTEDGREAVFDNKDNVITEYPNKGTYNFGKQSLGGDHKKYDMKPFERMRDKRKEAGTW